jgi:hypothetical protein
VLEGGVAGGDAGGIDARDRRPIFGRQRRYDDGLLGCDAQRCLLLVGGRLVRSIVAGELGQLRQVGEIAGVRQILALGQLAT